MLSAGSSCGSDALEQHSHLNASIVLRCLVLYSTATFLSSLPLAAAADAPFLCEYHNPFLSLVNTCTHTHTTRGTKQLTPAIGTTCERRAFIVILGLYIRFLYDSLAFTGMVSHLIPCFLFHYCFGWRAQAFTYGWPEEQSAQGSFLLTLLTHSALSQKKLHVHFACFAPSPMKSVQVISLCCTYSVPAIVSAEPLTTCDHCTRTRCDASRHPLPITSTICSPTIHILQSARPSANIPPPNTPSSPILTAPILRATIIRPSVPRYRQSRRHETSRAREYGLADLRFDMITRLDPIATSHILQVPWPLTQRHRVAE